MDGKQFHTRIRGVVALLLAVLLAFTWVLYDLQIDRGGDFLAQSRRKIVSTETVDAARGEILDRYGRVLVSNRTSYNVSLDASLMNDRRNDIVLALLDICRAQGVAWTDTLPLSKSAPFTSTLADATAGAKKNFEKLAGLMKWDAGIGDPDALLAQMRATFEVDPALSDRLARDLVGVLYEVTLRSKEVSYVAYVFAQDVDIDFITAVKEAGLAGVEIDPTTVREYHTAYAAHLLGRVGLMDNDEWSVYKELGYPYNASVGKEGVERSFEEYLHGQSGVRAVETNTQGKVVSEYWVPDADGVPQVPQPGGNVVLTLDSKLQEVVERSLADRIAELKSEDKQGAAAVVIDVKDGGVLSMASYPTFDLSTYVQDYTQLAQDPLNPLRNRATQEIYPPGSAFKMAVAAGALEEGTITRSTKVLCTGRYTYYKNKADQPQCWIARQYGGRHGPEDVTGAIKDSCNIFFYDTGRRLGIDKIGEYARKFGLGEKTGIELYEETGQVAGPAYTESQGQRWYEGNVMYAAIGQESNAFTPLQLANYVATLANGGTHYSAHLLKEVKSNDYAQVTYQRQPEVLGEVGLSQENLDAITQGMLQVTTEGSARTYFKDLGVKVAAKTGSAQVSSATESNALFVCFAPYDDPEIAIAVVVEKGGSGSTIANIAVDILNYYFSTGNNMETVEEENSLLR